MSAPPKLPSPEGNVLPASANDTIFRSGESIREGGSNQTEKRQPWKSVWPNTKQAGTQMQVYGFKKGEVMEILGNAGNFFAHGDWELEHDTLERNESEAVQFGAETTEA